MSGVLESESGTACSKGGSSQQSLRHDTLSEEIISQLDSRFPQSTLRNRNINGLRKSNARKHNPSFSSFSSNYDAYTTYSMSPATILD